MRFEMPRVVQVQAGRHVTSDATHNGFIRIILFTRQACHLRRDLSVLRKLNALWLGGSYILFTRNIPGSPFNGPPGKGVAVL